jgi:hypothetical protein
MRCSGIPLSDAVLWAIEASLHAWSGFTPLLGQRALCKETAARDLLARGCEGIGPPSSPTGRPSQGRYLAPPSQDGIHRGLIYDTHVYPGSRRHLDLEKILDFSSCYGTTALSKRVRGNSILLTECLASRSRWSQSTFSCLTFRDSHWQCANTGPRTSATYRHHTCFHVGVNC